MNARFKELDHRIGRHSSPDEGCPVCFPGVEPSFTAVGTTTGIDYAGLFHPGVPNFGDTWHELGSGIWVFTKTSKRGMSDTEGVWVNALSQDRRERDEAAWIGTGLFHERVSLVQESRAISEEMLRSKVMGVNIINEVQEQLKARIAMHIAKASMIEVSPIELDVIPSPFKETTTMTASVKAIRRPTLV